MHREGRSWDEFKQLLLVARLEDQGYAMSPLTAQAQAIAPDIALPLVNATGQGQKKVSIKESQYHCLLNRKTNLLARSLVSSTRFWPYCCQHHEGKVMSATRK